MPPALGRRLGAGLTAVAVGLCVTPATAAAAPARELTAVTFNMAHGHLAGGDLARIATVLRGARADVIALQEVDRSWSRSGSVDQPAELGRLLGMRHFYDPNLDCASRDEAGDGFCQYGTAILTPHALVAGSGRRYPLPSPPSEEPRGMAKVAISVGGHTVDVFNTHLSFVAPTRRAQVEAVKARVQGDPRPFVLAGDLNALPFHREMASLRRRTRDAAVAAGRGDLRTTALAHPVRIDYVMLPLRPFNGPRTTLAALDARVIYASRLSDHRPLVVRLRIPAS